MKAVVIAGGKGTRLLPYTRVFPKSMLPIGDKTILEVMLLQIKQAGITEVIISVGHMAGIIEAFFGQGEQLGLNITYCYEHTPLGTAGSLAFIKGLNEPFLIANADVLTNIRFNEIISFHKESGCSATIAVFMKEYKLDLGVIKVSERNMVEDYSEKPIINFMVSMGIYIFNPVMLKYINPGQRIDIPELIKRAIMAGEQVKAYPFNGYWLDIGNPLDYEKAETDFEEIKELLLPDEKKGYS